MGTTANYSWPTPVATDLVKDGWEAIKDLGDAADTTVKAVSDAQGLVHINTTSFSAVSSQSINDVFSSTYDAYRIVFFNTKSQSSNTALRLRVSGADDTNSFYGSVRIKVSATTLSQAAANTTSMTLCDSDTQSQSTTLDILEPFSSSNETLFQGHSTSGIYATNPQVSVNFGRFGATTSFTGFTLLPSAGTMTGYVSVYGYKK